MNSYKHDKLLYNILYSQFVYDLYKCDGLPSSREENITKVHKWIKLIGNEVGMKLNPTIALAKKVSKKTYTVVNTVNKLRKQGGRQMNSYLQKEWSIQLSPSEVESPQQTALENELKKATEEKDKLEEEKNTILKQNASLKSQLTHLAEQMQKAQSSGYQPTRGKSKNKSQYSQRWVRKMKQQQRTKCSSSLAWLESEGYTVLKVTVQNNTTGSTEVININPEELFGPQGSLASEKDVDILNMMLYVKDKYNISGTAYHEMAQLCKNMPRHYKLKERISELNKFWNIHPMPDDVVGVQQSFEERLRICLQHLV